MLLSRLLLVLLANRPTNGRAVEELAKTAAAAAQQRAADAAFEDYKEAAVFASQRRLMVTLIKCRVFEHKMVLFQVRVCLLNCAEEVCLKNVNAAQLQNQNSAFMFSLAPK